MNKNLINLDSLFDLSAKLNEIDDYHFILNSALLSLLGKLFINRAAVYLPENDTFILEIQKGKSAPERLNNIDLDSISESSNPELFAAGFSYILPVKYKNELLAVIVLSKKIIGGDASDEELQYAKLVSTICANALSNARNYKRIAEEKSKVETQNQLLSAMFDMSRDFSTLTTYENQLRMLSYHLMGQLMISKFALIICRDKNKKENFNIALNRFQLEPPSSVVMEFANINKLSLCSELNLSPSTAEYIKQNSIQLICPMILQGETKGLLLIANKMAGEFSPENLQYLAALANTAISSIENHRLFNEELEKKKLESELLMALEIQQNLMPKSEPKLSGYQISGKSLPSRHVGGDYFDYIHLSSNRIILAIGDVSGKGMPASLIMANLQAALRVLSSLDLSLEQIVKKLNEVIYFNTSADKFVTFFCAILDAENHHIEYVNAGHNPPIIFKKDGEKIELKTGGLILGFLNEEAKYSVGTAKLNDDDILLLYTDGMIESFNSSSEDYGLDELIKLIENHKEQHSKYILDKAFDAINDFVGSAPQYDDLTMIILKKQ